MAETRGPTQIQNRNFLAPVGFKFNLQRSPGVAYFCNQANIPDISLGVANQANYLRDIPTPGDKMDFGDLSLRFLVDEDLKNYMEIQKWMRGLGFPESLQEFDKFEKEGKKTRADELASEGIVLAQLAADYATTFSAFCK